MGRVHPDLAEGRRRALEEDDAVAELREIRPVDSVQVLARSRCTDTGALPSTK